MSFIAESALREAVLLARQGRLSDACDVGTLALTSSEDPALHAFVGAVQLQLGRVEDAVAHLQSAHDAQPSDRTVHANLIDALILLGRDEEALLSCPQADASADPTLRLLRLRAHLLQGAGDLSSAIAAYFQIVEAQPQDWASLNNLGNSLSAAGRFEEAVGALSRAAQLVPDSPPVRLNYANALLDAGQVSEAEAAFRAVAEAFPNDANPLVDLFTLYKGLGREEESLAALRAALARDPESPTLNSDLGQECAWRNLYGEAEAAFERALLIDPTLSPAYVGIASVYERTNRETELDPLERRARESGADSETLHFIRALILKRANRFDDALASLELVGEAVIAPRRLNLRGQLLERLGRSDEAFEAFAEMNRQWSEDPSQPRQRGKIYYDAVLKAEALMVPDWVASWTTIDVAPLKLLTPVFLLGFPRSGTTLLDTMLMGHPNTVVLEEEPFIAEIERDLGGIEELPRLSAAQIGRAREAYIAKVAERTTLRPESLIVDKHPLHTNKIPVIRRLFPDARIILTLRHPCDVLLSCFITNFRLNDAMVNFLDLGDTASLYDLTFRNFEKALNVLNPRVHTVIYERMIDDPRRELEALLEFMSLDWCEEVLNHNSTARKRGPVRTASYAQVTEPLYGRAVGRWARYRKHLEDVIPLLAPWIEKFGYSLEDGRYAAWSEPDVEAGSRSTSS